MMVVIFNISAHGEKCGSPPSAVSARWYAVQALDAVTDQCLSISGAREEVTTTNLKGQNLKNKFQIQFQERGFNYGKIS